MQDKKTLRDEARARRASLSHVHGDFAARLSEHADALGIAEGSVVGGYATHRDEADPSRLLARLAARGCLVVFPRVGAKDQPLVFHVVPDGEALAAGTFGIREPSPRWPAVVPNVVLVPLLAFDGAGHRLGYGGGHYDRTLADLRANGSPLAIGVAFAGQEIAAVPGQRHDQRLDMVVTELGVRRFL